MSRIELSGTVAGVFIASDPESLESAEQESVRVTFSGFPGDRHEGINRRAGVREKKLYPKGTEIKNNRQISIVSKEELAEIAAGMRVPFIAPEWLGANISTFDIPDLTSLPPSTRFIFQRDAAIVIDAENLPCEFPGEVIAKYYHVKPIDFPKAAIHRRGLVGYVEREGEIHENDTVRVVIPEQRIYSLPSKNN
jgi:hypothetical protein